MKKKQIGTPLILLCAAGALLGSGNGTVNIGDTQVRGSQLSDYAAVWDGYAQAYTFGDGSDHLRLTIDAGGHGVLQVGDSAPLPAPSDPSVGYPAGYQGMFGTSGIAPPNPGFAYPIHATQVQSDRIQLGIDFNDLYSAWCGAESSFAHPTHINGPADYGCLPEVQRIDHPANQGCTAYFPDGTSQAMDCGKLSLCVLESVCTCTVSGCTATLTSNGTPPTQYSVEIDGALDGTGSALTGTFLVQGGARVTVVLQKQD
jgi:hypothetical protein